MNHNRKTKFTIGNVSKCPTCKKSVYAAEQVLGPGSTPYHKICLKCKHCSKILDPFNLLEHEYDPYCKICHSKQFGIKGFGYGNILVGEYSSDPSTSPKFKPITTTSSQKINQSKSNTSNFHFNSNKYEINSNQIIQKSTNCNINNEKSKQGLNFNEQQLHDNSELPSLNNLKIIVKGKEKIKLKSTEEKSNRESNIEKQSNQNNHQEESLNKSEMNSILINHNNLIISTPKLKPKPTCFKESPEFQSNLFRTDAPQQCPSCNQTVYHAEQVLAIGKKWHKRCLKCWKCKKVLNFKFNERIGKPFCVKCYDDEFGNSSHGFVLRAGF